MLPVTGPAVGFIYAQGMNQSTSVERAIELYAVVSRYPYVANSRWFEDIAGQHIAAAAESLPPEVVQAARERGRARDLWKTAKELLAELERRKGIPQEVLSERELMDLLLPMLTFRRLAFGSRLCTLL